MAAKATKRVNWQYGSRETIVVERNSILKDLAGEGRTDRQPRIEQGAASKVSGRVCTAVSDEASRRVVTGQKLRGAM